MKTKAKLLLAISTLSAVVLAAGVTSTFAWFTTQSLVQAKTGTLTVKSPATLSIKGYDLVKGAALAQTSDTVVTGTDAELGAVSSKEGQTFYAPADWDAASHVMTQVGKSSGVPYLAENPYVGYIQYSLAVTAAKGEDGKHLKAYVTVDETKAGTTGLVDWYRVAIYHVETIVEGASGYSEEAKTTVSTPATSKVFAHAGSTTDKYWNVTAEATRTIYQIGKTTAIELDSFTTQQDKNVAAHFVVAVWMEGCAGADQNSAGNQSVAVTANFELY